MNPPLLLRELPLGARLGLTGMVLTLIIGLIASGVHLAWHHQNRDERPGISVTDVMGAYHGVDAPSKLVTALERGHPAELSQSQRDALMDWLLGKRDAAGARPPGGNPRITEDYDNLDLGDNAPREIMAASCMSCHARNVADAKGAGVPLEYLDDVKKLAFTKVISRTPDRVLIMSMHAHATSLGMLSVVLALLLWFSRTPRKLASGLIGLNGLCLFADIASWWLARDSGLFVYIIVLTGGLANLSSGLMALFVLGELWRPRRKA